MRAFYYIALCGCLALLATMWLRPGIAQEMIQLARSVRAQSPDPRYGMDPRYGAAPAGDPSFGVPYGVVGGPPTQPQPVTRPVSWPGTPVDSYAGGANQPPPAQTNLQGPPSYGTPQGPAPYGAYPQTATPNAVGLNPQLQQPQPPAVGGANTNVGGANLQILPGQPRDIPDSQIVATVGSEVILASDVKARFHEIAQQRKLQIPPEQMAAQMEMAMRPLLGELVQKKLVYNDAIQTIPAPGLAKVQAEIGKSFDTEQLPLLMKANKVNTREELDTILRSRGSSLEYERRAFFEFSLFRGWFSEKVKRDPEIPHFELIGYYNQHLADYEFPAEVRWEELMVSFDRFPNKSAAFAALANMGNQVMQGAPFAEVAKTASHGVTAAQGGVYDWTTQGSLLYKSVDQALFALPPGSLSRILESERGFHIVRVVERKAARRTPFTEAQGEIKKQLKDQKRDEEIKKFIDDLKKRTPVRTIYDNEPGGLAGPPRESSQF